MRVVIMARKSEKKLSFVGQLYSLLAMAALPVFVIFLLSVWWNESYSLERMLLRYGQSLIGGFSESARLGVDLEDARLVKDAVASVHGMDDVLQLDIYDVNGRRMVSLKRQTPALQLAVLRRASGDAVESMTVGQEERFVAAIGGNQNGIVGYVVMDLSRHRVRLALDGALAVAFAVCLLLFMVFWMLIWHGFNRLSRPLFELDSAVASVTDGDLSVSIHDDVSEPFGRMARGFNSMVKTLAQSRKESEMKAAALAESEKRFRELFLHMPVAMYLADMHGRLRECNPAMADMCGYASYHKMLASVECDAQLYGGDGERKGWLDEVLNYGRLAGRETQLISANGNVLHCLMYASLVRDNDGEPEGVEVLLQDVTELRLLEESMVQAQKMEVVGELAGGVAHDFNNLMTIVQGHAESLDEQTAGNDGLGHHVEQIMLATERASHLTSNLLGFARKGEMRRETIRLHSLLQEVVNLLAETGNRSVNICLNGDTDVAVLGDPGQLHQVFMNLGINAMHAMPDGGDLTFALLHSGGNIMVRVSDTGIGMPPEVVAHIFEPFFTTRETGEGTGLGLSMVHGIIKRQGGKIRVESIVGKGTVFELLMPEGGDVEVAKRPVSKGNKEIPNVSGTVLMVDDESELLELAGLFLTRSGFEVIKSSSGEAALQYLADARHEAATVLMPDVVLLDMNMPGIGGEETLRRIHRLYPQLAVIVQSGYSETTLSQEVEGLDYAGFVAKPYKRKALCAEIMRVLSEHGQ